jgi:two-component system, LytTR family, response regulator
MLVSVEALPAAELSITVQEFALASEALVLDERHFSKRQRSLKLVIVDNERSVRTEFAELCGRESGLQVVGEADSGRAGIGVAENLRPDVMLIDVRLPDMNGFDVMRASGAQQRPLFIMTSRQSEHAAQAFDEGAVDYLLKPVSKDRFADAILRARDRVFLEDAAKAQLTQNILQLMGRRPKFLVGERQRRLYPLDIAKIDYIEADGNYVTIMAGDSEYVSRDSIKRLSAELADFGFVRIDRSLLLNIRSVAFAEPIGHGSLAFTLSSGTCLHSSRTYREDILRVLPWHQCRSGSVAENRGGLRT